MRPEAGESAPRSTAARLASAAIEPRATIGSGDAFLAGFVAARYYRPRASDCLAYGVACGAESTQPSRRRLIESGAGRRSRGDRGERLQRPPRSRSRRSPRAPGRLS
jgi:1-phosphofructokinase/tagatose 6-phosphate kinase